MEIPVTFILEVYMSRSNKVVHMDPRYEFLEFGMLCSIYGNGHI